MRTARGMTAGGDAVSAETPARAAAIAPGARSAHSSSTTASGRRRRISARMSRAASSTSTCDTPTRCNVEPPGPSSRRTTRVASEATSACSPERASAVTTRRAVRSRRSASSAAPRTKRHRRARSSQTRRGRHRHRARTPRAARARATYPRRDDPTFENNAQTFAALTARCAETHELEIPTPIELLVFSVTKRAPPNPAPLTPARTCRGTCTGRGTAGVSARVRHPRCPARPARPPTRRAPPRRTPSTASIRRPPRLRLLFFFSGHELHLRREHARGQEPRRVRLRASLELLDRVEVPAAGPGKRQRVHEPRRAARTLGAQTGNSIGRELAGDAPRARAPRRRRGTRVSRTARPRRANPFRGR